MQQRLGLARTLVHDPKVLILDEPASGLDPRARIEIRALLREVKQMGKTIIISSHILTELAELCDTVGIIESGRLIFSGTQQELALKTGTGGTIEVGVAENADAAIALLKEHPMVLNAERDTTFIRVHLAPEAAEDHTFIARLLVENGYGLTLLREEQVKLEDVFMKITKGIVS
jgi:ABC-2 type transport system ATP-binding protein